MSDMSYREFVKGLSNETSNVKVRVHGRDYVEQTANDQVHKVLAEATAQAVQSLICDAVEQALDLSWKAHGGETPFREWFEPVRERAADGDPFSTVNLFIAQYLNLDV
ncbi:hypothetical protein [Streptomyces sp. NPDC059452]|uniref:hypothetical protein n=1 Tax=Streptomyces sp. NPDC059452 TaxID=3346835 RepID=UPI00368A9A4D